MENKFSTVCRTASWQKKIKFVLLLCFTEEVKFCNFYLCSSSFSAAITFCSLYLSVSVCLSVCLCVSVCVSVSMCLSVSVSLCLCVFRAWFLHALGNLQPCTGSKYWAALCSFSPAVQCWCDLNVSPRSCSGSGLLWMSLVTPQLSANALRFLASRFHCWHCHSLLHFSRWCSSQSEKLLSV